MLSQIRIRKMELNRHWVNELDILLIIWTLFQNCLLKIFHYELRYVIRLQ